MTTPPPGQPPQGPPPQGGGWHEAPAAPPRRRKRMPLIIGIVVVAALVVGGGLWFVLRGGGDTSSPKAVTKAFYDAAKVGDDDLAKSFVCANRRGNFSIGMVARKQTYTILGTSKEGGASAVHTEVGEYGLTMVFDVIVNREHGAYCVEQLRVDLSKSRGPGLP